MLYKRNVGTTSICCFRHSNHISIRTRWNEKIGVSYWSHFQTTISLLVQNVHVTLPLGFQQLVRSNDNIQKISELRRAWIHQNLRTKNHSRKAPIVECNSPDVCFNPTSLFVIGCSDPTSILDPYARPRRRCTSRYPSAHSAFSPSSSPLFLSRSPPRRLNPPRIFDFYHLSPPLLVTPRIKQS